MFKQLTYIQKIPKEKNDLHILFVNVIFAPCLLNFSSQPENRTPPSLHFKNL